MHYVKQMDCEVIVFFFTDINALVLFKPKNATEVATKKEGNFKLPSFLSMKIF